MTLWILLWAYAVGFAMTFAFLRSIIGDDEPWLKLAGLSFAWPLTWLVAICLCAMFLVCECVDAVRGRK